MSIAVNSFLPVHNNLNTSAESERITAGSANATQQQLPTSGAFQTPQSSDTKVAPVNYIPPQDVVEVHQSPDVKGQIVVEYLDKAKNVVLQVPSAAELDFESAVAQEFQRAQKEQAGGSAAPGYATGVKSDGNQL